MTTQDELANKVADLSQGVVRVAGDMVLAAEQMMAVAGEIRSWQPPSDDPIDPPVDDGSGDNTDDTTDDPVVTPGDGWTEFPDVPGARHIYVSSTDDVDPPLDVGNGSRMYSVRTVAEGLALLRHNHPDRLWLHRGETFKGPLASNWMLGGRSADEPMVIGAYGDIGLPRPVIETAGDEALNFHKNDERKHIAFVDLEFRGIGFVDEGVKINSSGVSNVLFEGCKISGYRQGMAIQVAKGNIRLHRCVIVDNDQPDRTSKMHGMGIYTNDVDGVTIEECIFDHNGWVAGDRDNTATIFNHNVYIDTKTRNLVFRNNFVSRGSSHGIQARTGGDITGNVLWGNPIAILAGNEGRGGERSIQGGIVNNVILGTGDIAIDEIRRWGIQVQNANRFLVAGNILSSPAGYERSRAFILKDDNPAKNRNLTVSSNAIDGYQEPFRIGDGDSIDVVVRGNQIAGAVGGLPSVDGVSYTGNVFEADALGLTLNDAVRALGLANSAAEFADLLHDARKGKWTNAVSQVAEWFREQYGVEG